jgi:hypothetical protein
MIFFLSPFFLFAYYIYIEFFFVYIVFFIVCNKNWSGCNFKNTKPKYFCFYLDLWTSRTARWNIRYRLRVICASLVEHICYHFDIDGKKNNKFLFRRDTGIGLLNRRRQRRI